MHAPRVLGGGGVRDLHQVSNDVKTCLLQRGLQASQGHAAKECDAQQNEEAAGRSTQAAAPETEGGGVGGAHPLELPAVIHRVRRVHVCLECEVRRARRAEEREDSRKDAEDEQPHAGTLGVEVRERDAQREGGPHGEERLRGGEGATRAEAARRLVVVVAVVQLLELVEYVEDEVRERCRREGALSVRRVCTPSERSLGTHRRGRHAYAWQLETWPFGKASCPMSLMAALRPAFTKDDGRNLTKANEATEGAAAERQGALLVQVTFIDDDLESRRNPGRYSGQQTASAGVHKP